MQGVITVTRWILAICLLIGGILHIDIFSIIYVLLFLTIPWAFIRPTATRLRFFFILALIACITSGVFLLIIGSSLIILISSNGAANQENHRNKSSKFENTTVQTRLSNHFQSVPLRIRPIFIYFRSLLLLSIIHSCGCLVPSILSAFYFFICLGLALWWALGKHFARAYLWIIRSLQIYSLVHLLSVYVFQLPFVEQYLLETNMHLVRLFGLRFLYKRSCFTHKNDVKHNWIVYLHPFIILILYWISIYEYYRTRNYQQRLKAFLMESSLTQNNSQMTSIEISTETRQSDRFHFHTITDLFWLAPSKAILNETKLNHSDENLFYKTNSLLIALLSYILSKAYILSVISMLLWSITYHSYLTLVYLILACFLWLLPNTKYWCHFFSIFFCIYAYILLIINYVDVLNIIPEEFLWRIQDIEFLHVNDENSNYASISIYIKCTMKFIYTLLLLLPLRQKTKERSQNIKNVSTSSINLFEHIELIPPVRYVYKSPINQPISRLNQIFICIKSQWSSIHYEIYYIFYMGYARIWLFNLFFHWSRLFIMILVFILSSCTDSLPVIYRIVYMGFFLQYYLCYSISKKLWNIYLFPFYLTLVIYSIIVLFTMYIYQFDDLKIIKSSICLTYIRCESLLLSLGIRHVDNNGLIRGLFTPTIFIICIVIHINFFHRHKSLNSSINMEEISSIKIFHLILWSNNRFKRVRNMLWCLCELYIYKILLLMICFFLSKQTNICVTNFILVFIFVISLFSSILQSLALGIYALVSTINILMIMIIRSELFSSLGYINNVCLPSSSSKL
ncbi:unnamed protein product [Rotaria magnacalcarata]|uniref:Piezo TM1-24 domain-containing protein n=1 Tax=Rotaria magnacalcarata TaxID=392030 RepID=A0A8S2P9Z6_9BILA|nr:unnamed protein product [Rotaria magnacalcarata]CAF4041596.1 unnamed protein product [Rotaria magnacalcarata]